MERQRTCRSLTNATHTRCRRNAIYDADAIDRRSRDRRFRRHMRNPVA